MKKRSSILIIFASMLMSITAFASNGEVEAKAKIIGAETFCAGGDVIDYSIEQAELQIKIASAAYTMNTPDDVESSITLHFENATIDDYYESEWLARENIKVVGADGGNINTIPVDTQVEKDEVTITFERKFQEDEVIAIQLFSLMDKTSAGKEATVSITGDFAETEELVFASVAKDGITVSTKDTVAIAQDEVTPLYSKGVKITRNAGYFSSGEYIELKMSKGFQFAEVPASAPADKQVTVNGETLTPSTATDANAMGLGEILYDGEEAIIRLNTDMAPALPISGQADNTTDALLIKNLQVDSDSAKVGAMAKLTVAYQGTRDVVEVAEVVDYEVELTVDADEKDLPIMYSGVDVNNYGITDDSDHWTLEVTAEETFPGAWGMRKGFSFTLPEGVYATDVEVLDADGFTSNGGVADVTAWDTAFKEAYQNGDHKSFAFSKRVFDDVDTQLREDVGSVTFRLQLVADPTFAGDVVLGMEGDLVGTHEVIVAHFQKPYTVTAERNDLAIDYRYTDIPTAIVVKEGADGLFAKNDATFDFNIETQYITFEEDATFIVEGASGLELKEADTDSNRLSFTVKAESEEAATITIEDMQLFMQRNIPAGPYRLELTTSLAHADTDKDGKITVADAGYLAQGLLAPDEDAIIDDVCDYDTVVKEGFVNIITAGRNQDDASFTTKVIVPLGESYVISNETQIALDAPAYISAGGYTMLPVRAVAKALGINSACVLWSEEASTVTILYGQRVICMTIGERVMYVNGTAIPASAAIEISNERTFLPMRDLATALGVTDITWDEATQTATLNGSQTAAK